MENLSDEKREKIDAIFDNKAPDAVFVLSADIAKDDRKTLGYKVPSYSDTDVRGLLSGAKARVSAAATVAKYYPDAYIVPDSRDRDPSRKRPTHASIYAEALKGRGVREDRIRLEEESVNTITEIVEEIKMAVENGWRTIALVSNEYHLERIREMYARIEELADPNDVVFAQALAKFRAGGGTIQCISAEEVLIIQDRRYAEVFRQAKGTLAYHVRVLSEQKGIHDLKTRQYDVKKSLE